MVMAEMNKNKLKYVIVAVSLLQMGNNAIASILGNIAEAFPQASSTSVQFLMSFPPLLVLVFSLIMPVIASRISKRRIILTGCSLFAMSGILSWLMHSSLGILYVWAAMMGTGVGLAATAITSLISEHFEGNQRETLMGWQSSATNVGAMLMAFTGGLLAAIHWSYNYLVYLIIIPGLILTFLYVPEEAPARNSSTENPFTLLKKKRIVLCCLLACTASLLFSQIPTNISMYVLEKGFGSAAQAGFCATLLLLSGTVCGLIFGRLVRIFHRYVIAVGFTVMMIGALIVAFAGSLYTVFAGCAIAGFAISAIMPQCLNDAANNCDGRISSASGLIMASGNFGAFIAPLLTTLAALITGSSAVEYRFRLCAVLAGAALVAALVVIRRINVQEQA